MKSELARTLADVPEYRHVQCYGLHGTYDDGLAWLGKPEHAGKPKTILSMGSSIGNFTRNEAAGFVRQFAAALGPEDNLLFGVDACQDTKKVHQAYNDSHGYGALIVSCCASLIPVPASHMSSQLMASNMPTSFSVMRRSIRAIGKPLVNTTSKAADTEPLSRRKMISLLKV